MEFQTKFINDLIDMNIPKEDALNIFKIFNIQLNLHYKSYHNAKHVMYMRNFAESNYIKLSKPLKLAIWAHDLFYVPKLNINEEVSTYILYDIFKYHLDFQDIQKTNKLILVTKQFLKSDEELGNLSDDEKLIMDLDLSILTDNLQNVISANLSLISEGSQTNEGSLKFFQTLLNREFIYRSEFFRSNFEKIAKENCSNMLEFFKN